MTAAFCGCLPGSGSLECGLGLIGDIVTPRCGRLDTGMVDAILVSRLYRGELLSNMRNIKKLENGEWKSHIPSRPDIPDGYFDDDDDDDNGDQQQDGIVDELAIAMEDAAAEAEAAAAAALSN